MNQDKEQVETVIVPGKERRNQCALIGSALSDGVYNQLRIIVHALARSAAVAEHH